MSININFNVCGIPAQGVLMKNYPLKLENCGEDEYCLMSRGHHEEKEFMEEVKSWGWPMGKPKHVFWKATPTRIDGFRCMYNEVSKSVKGSFPVTVCYESYGEDQYKY